MKNDLSAVGGARHTQEVKLREEEGRGERHRRSELILPELRRASGTWQEVGHALAGFSCSLIVNNPGL